MKILLTNSPAYIKGIGRFTYGSRFGCKVPLPIDKRIPFYTPYMWSMGYGSSLLKRDTDNEVKALDAQAQILDDKQFRDQVKKFNPDIIIADLPTVSFDLMMDLLKEIKDDSGCEIGISGLHPSGLPMKSIKNNPFVDFVLTGEYELILKDLLLGIEGKKSFNDIPNLFFRENGKIVKTKPSKDPFLGIDFDSLPYPDREDMPVSQYHDMDFWGYPGVQMLTSRGCPSQCRFCCTTIMAKGGVYWQRNPKKVVEEMEFVKEKYKAKSIYLDDDVVLPNMIEGMIKEIKSRGLDIPWTFMGSINLSEDVLVKAKKAGCVGLKFGIESINPNVLDGIHKSWIIKDRVKNFVDLCKKHDLFTHGTFIVGLPHDDKQSILETLRFTMKLDLDSFQVYTLVPLPGTPLYFEAKEKGWIFDDRWINYDGDDPIMDYPWLSNKEIRKLFDKWIETRHKLILKKRLKNPSKMLRNIFYTDPKALFLKIKNLLFSGGKEPI